MEIQCFSLSLIIHVLYIHLEWAVLAECHTENNMSNLHNRAAGICIKFESRIEIDMNSGRRFYHFYVYKYELQVSMSVMSVFFSLFTSFHHLRLLFSGSSFLVSFYMVSYAISHLETKSLMKIYNRRWLRMYPMKLFIAIKCGFFLRVFFR